MKSNKLISEDRATKTAEILSNLIHAKNKPINEIVVLKLEDEIYSIVKFQNYSDSAIFATLADTVF